MCNERIKQWLMHFCLNNILLPRPVPAPALQGEGNYVNSQEAGQVRPLSLRFVLVWRRQHEGRTDRRSQRDRLQCCCNDAAYIQKSSQYLRVWKQLYICIYIQFFYFFFTAEIRGWSQKIRGYSPECPGLTTRLMHTLEPGLTKIRDTVTLFNLLKRDQGHVFSKFCISIVIICRVTKHDFQTKVPSGSVLPNVP